MAFPARGIKTAVPCELCSGLLPALARFVARRSENATQPYVPSLRVARRTSVLLGWSVDRTVFASWLLPWLAPFGCVATVRGPLRFGCLGYELGVTYLGG